MASQPMAVNRCRNSIWSVIRAFKCDPKINAYLVLVYLTRLYFVARLNILLLIHCYRLHSISVFVE